MTFLKKLKSLMIGEPDLEMDQYKKDLKKEYAKKNLKAKYEKELKDIKQGKPKDFGMLGQFGKHILKASDRQAAEFEKSNSKPKKSKNRPEPYGFNI